MDEYDASIQNHSTVMSPDHQSSVIRKLKAHSIMAGNPQSWGSVKGFRQKPGVGSGSLDYYNNKFHEEFLKKA